MTPELEQPLGTSEAREKPRLLLVDDDVKFCRLISTYLGRYSYEVTVVHDGLSGLNTALSSKWDAIILDVMLPGLDGYCVLRKLREQTQLPVVMLTALGNEDEKIIGLELGADDYLPKTSSPRELVARLRAVLRRTNRHPLAADLNEPEIVIGTLLINPCLRIATNVGEQLLLTHIEFDLLLVLAKALGRIKTREQMLNEIREKHFDISDRSIDVHISALRKKLRDDAKCPRLIRTVRTAGYMMIKPSEQND